MKRKTDLPQALWSTIRRNGYAKRREIVRAAGVLVNPLTGFTLSDYHLSAEVHSRGWFFLNPKSRNLAAVSLKKITSGSIIYVDTKETDLFAREYLPHITSDFILISSQLGSPPQPSGPTVDTIFSHPGLLAWFTPNREEDNLPFRPFPAGVALRGITNIHKAMTKHKSVPRANEIYVPHCAVHPHLVGNAAETRRALQPYMSKPLRHQDYLEQLARHRFIISPAGDKPDTFRHWESVAMGAIPVSTLPRSFAELFGDSLILVDDLVKNITGPFESARVEANRDLVTVDYWRQVVTAAKFDE